MVKVVVVCTDGSDIANRAAVAGLAILRPAERVIVTAVIDAPDEMEVTGTGMAGGTMTAEEFADAERARQAEGQALAAKTAALLESNSTEIQVLQGSPGPALCSFASEVSADALVAGSRGLGRVKRALLGSVSEYLVRTAPCPVVVWGPTE